MGKNWRYGHLKEQTESKDKHPHTLYVDRTVAFNNLCKHFYSWLPVFLSCQMSKQPWGSGKVGLITNVVIHTTEGFNLRCNNVARKVKEKWYPFYQTLRPVCEVFSVFKMTSRLFLSTIIPLWIIFFDHPSIKLRCQLSLYLAAECF